MTDVMGKQPKVGDTLAMAFESGSQGYLRVGTIEGFEEADGRMKVYMRWTKSSWMRLPDSPVTRVELRNYVIVD